MISEVLGIDLPAKGPEALLSENAKVVLTGNVARPRCLREMMVQCFSRTASLG